MSVQFYVFTLRQIKKCSEEWHGSIKITEELCKDKLKDLNIELDSGIVWSLGRLRE